MASYLSQIISNTLGFSGAGQIQPEVQPSPYLGLSNEPDPFVDNENSIPGSDFSINEFSEKGEHVEPLSSAISDESPVQDFAALPLENAEGRLTPSRKSSHKKEDKPYDLEKVIQEKPEAKTIISTEIKSSIPIPPVKKRVVQTEPGSRKDSQSKASGEPHQPLPINLLKEEPIRSSTKAKQEIISNEKVTNRNGTSPEKKIKIIEPEILSHPIFHQQLIQQSIERGSHDILPNEPLTPIPIISNKQETRLIIGKLTVEVIQPAKENNIQLSQPVMVNNKPARSSHQRHEGGSTLKVKYGLGQI